MPAPGDYDGDGTTDRGILNQVTGVWKYQTSSNGEFVTTGAYGGPDWAPAPGDYDGDGQTEAGPPVVPDAVLDTDERLTIGQTIRSANGECRLSFQTDNQVVIYRGTPSPQNVVWTADTQHSGADAMVMQPDGNLVIYKPGGTAVFKTDTRGTNATATLRNDCLLVVKDGNGKVLWDSVNGKPAPPVAPKRSELRTGERLNIRASLHSSNGQCQLAFQPDQQLVIYDLTVTPKKAVWNAGSQNSGAQSLVMQDNGNLALYKADGRTDVWATGTEWHDLKAIIGDDCVLRIETQVGTLWWDNISGHSDHARRNGAAPADPAAAPSTPRVDPQSDCSLDDQCAAITGIGCEGRHVPDERQWGSAWIHQTRSVSATVWSPYSCQLEAITIDAGERVFILGESNSHWFVDVEGSDLTSGSNPGRILKVSRDNHSTFNTLQRIRFPVYFEHGRLETTVLLDRGSTADLARRSSGPELGLTILETGLSLLPTTRGGKTVVAELAGLGAFSELLSFLKDTQDSAADAYNDGTCLAFRVETSSLRGVDYASIEVSRFRDPFESNHAKCQPSSSDDQLIPFEGRYEFRERAQLLLLCSFTDCGPIFA